MNKEPEDPEPLLNSKELWVRVKEYRNKLTPAEKTLIRQHFYILGLGNDIEYESSAHAEDMYFRFELAWIMSALWK